MKRNPISLSIGVLLLILFLLLVFTYQVRLTEVAAVTRFGSYSRMEPDPGLHFRLPPGIERVYHFDTRLQNFERKFEQTFTRDKKAPVIAIYVGWKIKDPKTFLERFSTDDVTTAERSLEGLMRDAQSSVIGQHDFTELVSPDPSQVKFDVIEHEIQEAIAGRALSLYGVAIELVGIKQLNLPESLTAKVFDRMKTERESQVKRLIAEGTATADQIISDARLKRDNLLANAQREAQVIRGEAEAKSMESYRVLNQEESLARFIFELRALESLTNRTTLILDESTAPLDLLKGSKLFESH
jgi:membrane protease subunit HflC